MILLIDNYDSFVYNLARYINELNEDVLVKRNSEITIKEIAQLNPSHIIISPGPCTPNEAGISLAIIKELAPAIPILGVCLGHQAIGQVYGGIVERAAKPIHGKSAVITHEGKDLFTNLPNPLTVARYHSLIVSKQNFPKDLMITANAEDGEIMALRHRQYPTFGVQFHPESILTECGHLLLKNFIQSSL